MKSKTKKKPSMRGKWSRNKWIRVLEILNEMPLEERGRCIRATVAFFEGRNK